MSKRRGYTRLDDNDCDCHEADNRRNETEERERKWSAVAEKMANDIFEKEKRLKEMCQNFDWGQPKGKKNNCKPS